MEYAKDPIRNDDIDVAEYIKRYGQRGAGDDDRLPARCPVCRQVVRPRGELTPNAHQHFAHLRGATPCPTQARAAEPYVRLAPTDPDPQRAAWLKQCFAQDHGRALDWLRSLVPYLSPIELDDMLASAARVRLWEHRHLEPWQVPLCLLMTREFPPRTSLRHTSSDQPKRQWHFRFWFDPGVRTLEELWIRKPRSVAVHRGTYQPVASRPGPNNFVRGWSHVATPDLPLETAVPAPSVPLAAWFENVIRKHVP